MATYRWIGTSLNRRQVDTITCSGTGDWVSTDAITLSIDNVSVSITLGSGQTDTQVATTIYQAWVGTTLTDTSATLSGFTIADGGIKAIPQFSEMTATNPSAGVVSLISNGSGALAGKPWTLVVTVSVTGDENALEATATTPTSQYHADQADNYSGNALPTGGSDTLIFDHGSTDVRWGLDYATTLTAITKYKAYSGNVGLGEVNADNTALPYHEYRTTYLTCTGCTTANLEVGDGPGSGRFKLNTGTGQSAINIFGKGQRADSGIPCILWKGTHASNTVSNLAGDVGIAFFGSEVATVATLVTGDGPNSQASTYCGTGVTLTTVRLVGGQQVTQSAITTATQYAGTWEHYSGTVTTLVVHPGAVFRPKTAQTITTATCYGKIDLSQSAGTVTFTNLVTLDGNGEIFDPNGKAVFSAGYKLLSANAKVIRPVGDTHTLS